MTCPNCGGTIFEYDFDFKSIKCYMCGIHLDKELFEKEIKRRVVWSGRNWISYKIGQVNVTLTVNPVSPSRGVR